MIANRHLPERMRVKGSGTSLVAILALTLAGIIAPTNPVSASITVLNEDFSACTHTNGAYADTSGGGTIGIDTYNNPDNGSLSCSGWTFSGQAWLGKVTSNSNPSPPPAVGSYAMFLNEGNGSTTLGRMSRTLTGLTPGGFYEIIVLAWKDAAPGTTRLDLEVVSGTSTTYTMVLSDASAGPQTVRLRFPVETNSATITLTGGWRFGNDASPILGSIRVESYPTVFFLPNGGTGTMASQSESSPTALRTNAFTLEGCTFLEWQDEAGGTYIDGEEYNFSEDLTLTAQWSCPNDRPSYDIDIDIDIEHYRERSTLPDTI